MNNVLLIGATGKIGFNVLHELGKEKDFNIGVLTRRKGQPINFLKSYSIFFGDVLNASSLDQGIEWADIVINCSGLVSYNRSDVSKLKTINVDGVSNIVNACLKYNTPLIHTSSAISYGSSLEPIEFFEETDSIENIYRGPYAQSKYLADKLIMESSLSYVLLRPSTLVSTLKNLYGFYRKGMIAELQGGASFALMEEVVKAYVSAVKFSIQKPGGESSVFNLGGNNLRFKDVFEHFKVIDPRKHRVIGNSLMGGLSLLNDYFFSPVFKKSIITRDNFLTGNRFTYLNSDKAKEMLNYTITPFPLAVQKIL